MPAKFGPDKLLINQFIGHHGMSEMYTHMYASIFLFIVSLISVYILYRILVDESPFTWPGITAGMVAVGLIGLGEAAEHFFPTDPFGHNFFHYMHMIAAPVALYFLYVGAKEFVEECKNSGNMGGEGGVKPLSPDTTMAIFGGAIVLVVILAMISGSSWDPKIEGVFIYLTFIPTIYLAYLLIQQSRHTACKESIIMIFIPIIAISVTMLVFDIMFGRLMDIWGWAQFYVITHAAQNALHVATGTVLLLFSVCTYRAHKLGTLYVCGERPKYDPPPQEKIPMKDYF